MMMMMIGVRMNILSVYIATLILLSISSVLSIRFPDRVSAIPNEGSDQPLRTAVFALGSFWRSEATFGCLPGVVHTAAGYCGGSKSNPEYRSLGDHAECVQLLFHPFRADRIRSKGCNLLLEIFWTSHDSRQVFGQGADVGNQYRSIIFTNGTEESRLAAFSKEREQARSKNSVVTTQIQQLGTFYRAEAEHQKFELKLNPFLLQLIGNVPEEELEMSVLATKLNGYAAELCPPRIQKQIDPKSSEIVRKGWPILREIQFLNSVFFLTQNTAGRSFGNLFGRFLRSWRRGECFIFSSFVVENGTYLYWTRGIRAGNCKIFT